VPYLVERSAVADEQFTIIAARAAASPDTAEGILWREVEKELTVFVTNPEQVMSRTHQFTKTGHDFGNVFRTKPTGRTRLFYIASSRLQVVRVLYLGMLRKEGDKKDAYKEFSRLLKAGRFDADFAALRVGKPDG